MLGVAGTPRADLRQGQRVGIALPVAWFDIATPDTNATNNNNAASVYRQGYDQGGAKFNRLEGIWWDGEDSIFFASTSGGDVKNGDVNADGYRAGYGQIWQYRVNGAARSSCSSTSPTAGTRSTRPTTCAVTPRGGLILCEDDASGDSDIHPDAPDVGGNVNRLVGFARDGRVFDLAINILNSGELAGATFSPDGQTLFFNMLGERVRERAPLHGRGGHDVRADRAVGERTALGRLDRPLGIAAPLRPGAGEQAAACRARRARSRAGCGRR